jgi:SAM-dependent methyltransferase
MKSPLALEELLSALHSGSRVLDLGCGGGTFRYRDFPSIEIHAIDEGIHENVRGFPPNAHFVRAEASAIPWNNAVFDLVIVNFAFEHFPDPVAALKEIDRVAKDRAYVWISTPNAGSFEDQLYRNLFAGGGHLQSPSLERFLRLVYECTCLKLVSYLELPAGFTFLGNSEELRHLTWAIIDALRKSLALDAHSRSGYIFVLQKFSEAGPGFREYLRTCYACGSPDGLKSAVESGSIHGQADPWTCSRCGAYNIYPSSLKAVRLDEVEKAQRLQWERLPETHPARLREMVAERGRWGQELQQQLESLRKLHEKLHEEFDQRGQWALELDRIVKQQREEISRLGRIIAERETIKGYLKHIWQKYRRGHRRGTANG